MNKIYFIATLIICSQVTHAQVGINTISPNSTLDVVKNTTNPTSAKDGVIPPKLSKLELANKAANIYSTSQTGAIVYVNDIATPTGTELSITQVVQIDAIGYYYFDGTIWRKLVNATGGDVTNDAWVNGSSRVELGTTSTGSARAVGQNVSVTDTGYLNLGYTGSPDAGIHLVGDNDGYKDDIRIDSYGGTITGAPNIRFYASRGTQAAAIKAVDGDNIGQINFYTNTSATTTPDFGNPLTRITSFYKGTDKSELVFYVSGGGPAMTLNMDKNLGIGTYTPRTKLDVNGIISVTEQDVNVGISGTYTIPSITQSQIVLKDSRGSLYTVNVPNGVSGQKLVIVNTTGATATISSNSSTVATIATNTAKEFVFSGTRWYSF